MFDRLIEIGRCNGIEMNVDETKVISRLPYPVQIMID
jgi:hypothetical protein